jgi:hypothetical protein
MHAKGGTRGPDRRNRQVEEEDRKMKTLKFKSTLAGNGFVTRQNPMANTGHERGCITYAVIEIPESVLDSSVANLLSNTCTFLAEKAGRYEYKFEELGVGRILS